MVFCQVEFRRNSLGLSKEELQMKQEKAIYEVVSMFLKEVWLLKC